MNPHQFWTSPDGQILQIKNKDARTVALTLAFRARNGGEMEVLRAHLADLHFSERSTLARIGIEMMPQGAPVIDGSRLLLQVEAFMFDPNFPTAAFFKKLLRPGVPAGRLYYAPDTVKLSTAMIWAAVKDNRLKLPSTISIDRFGRVFLTPHQVRYTLNPRLQRPDFERLVSGEAGRGYLDKVQVRHETDLLSVPPGSGVLTSCSMYLKEHYVVLNRGEGNFGIHTGAVLLDPVKTFGTNIMLEIYNTGDQPIVNPFVSVEIFRAPEPAADPEFKTLRKKRARLSATAAQLYRSLDQNPPPEDGPARPRTKISVKGQSATMENRSLFFKAGSDFKSIVAAAGPQCGHRTLIQAFDAAPDRADTLLIDFFPNLLEHIELLTRIQRGNLRRIIFRRPSRTHGFFLSDHAHIRLENYSAIGLDVYWLNPDMNDLFLHSYKKDHGFFIREELVKKFDESTILAFYGSALGLDRVQTGRIAALMDKLTGFIGANVGVLTGGGGGVMRLATETARLQGALTGACFLELEAQAPEIGVDFFNTFQENSRHFRQKWFEVSDFCIFNVGGVGTLEEIGIELCNLKLGIRPRIPYVFYDARYFGDLRKQLREMIRTQRAPRWMFDYILFTDDPDEVVSFYRRTLKVL
jgi:predicted Rossmann-fold nucleotide-binding protein